MKGKRRKKKKKRPKEEEEEEAACLDPGRRVVRGHKWIEYARRLSREFSLSESQ